MRILTSIAYASLYTCATCMLMLSACGSPTGGYYDSNGKYVPYSTPNRNADIHAPDSGSMRYDPEHGDRVYYEHDRPYGYDDTRTYHTTTAYTFDRPGYYDYNGYYIPMSGRSSLPVDMMPPRGMCRLWLPNREPEDQPAVESCNGIHSRVPGGAYVIYGG